MNQGSRYCVNSLCKLKSSSCRPLGNSAQQVLQPIQFSGYFKTLWPAQALFNHKQGAWEQDIIYTGFPHETREEPMTSAWDWVVSGQVRLFTQQPDLWPYAVRATHSGFTSEVFTQPKVPLVERGTCPSPQKRHTQWIQDIFEDSRMPSSLYLIHFLFFLQMGSVLSTLYKRKAPRIHPQKLG